ncbi:MAG: hypothetical protein ABW352_04745 [Polyangiales bacterium]
MVASGRRILTGLAVTSLLACNRPPAGQEQPDLHCGSTFADDAHVRLCLRMAKNYEWTRQGHATVGFLGWWCTRKTVEAMVCGEPPAELAEVAAAHAVAESRDPLDAELAGCLGNIKLAIEARSLPKDHPTRQWAVFCK